MDNWDLKKALRLYAVTDRKELKEADFLRAIESALMGGITMLQLREKDMDKNELIELAKKVKERTDRYGVPLIINDDAAVAKACDAAGVHLGQDDGDPAQARKILGRDKIIGVTAKTVEQAEKAQTEGADYLGSGAVFGSVTKPGALPMTLDKLKEIISVVEIPVVAIGGIEKNNINMLKGTGIAGIALSSGIFSGADILRETVELLMLVKDMLD